VKQTKGLVLVPLLFLAAYLGFVTPRPARQRGRRATGPSRGVLRVHACAHGDPLPSCLLLHVPAHPRQSIIAYISDPFGRGWDPFGTEGYEIRVGVVGAAFIWYSQFVLVAGRHVAAVYLVHPVSLRLFESPKLALRSQSRYWGS
jgi:hypothetical protein